MKLQEDQEHHRLRGAVVRIVTKEKGHHLASSTITEVRATKKLLTFVTLGMSPHSQGVVVTPQLHSASSEEISVT